MKAFKGTLVAAVVLLGVGAAVYFLEDRPETIDASAVEDRPLFVFEKQDMVRVEVRRPDAVDIALKETPEGWIIEGTDFPASKSMVNRVRHQIHDLTARAKVIESPDDPALYGLGAQAIEVHLELRDGRTIDFKAGDPNPSSVSFYIQPIPGEAIYTVKKAAVDYYALDLDEFRERRFASFNSKDADRIVASLPNGSRLELQRTGEKSWEMKSPLEQPVQLSTARSLLGRVAVLKAKDFVATIDADADLEQWGLAEPRASVTISFGTRAPLTLHVGDPVPGETDPPMAYMTVQGEGSVYTAKSAFLEDYLEDPAEMRLRKVFALGDAKLTRISGTFHRHDSEDLVRTVKLKKIGDTWQWDDGKPVPGSTPRRLASRLEGLETEEFVDGAPTGFGLDDPQATLVVVDDLGTTHTLRFGDRGPSRTTPDDRELRRVYAVAEGSGQVHLVDEGVMEILEDALREHGRKLDKDADKAERMERMEQAREDDQ